MKTPHLRISVPFCWLVLSASLLIQFAPSVAIAQDEVDNTRQTTIANQWTEGLLFAIRRDLARPTVHARNLFHLSAAMYDAWALYDDTATTLFMGTSPREECALSSDDKNELLDGVADNTNHRELSQQKAIGHAAWNLLNHRFEKARKNTQLLTHFEQVANAQGLDKQDELLADADNPANIGLRIANCIIAVGNSDSSNEINNYANTEYISINPALNPTAPGNPGIVNPNRWQPLQLETFIDQSGNVTDIPTFLGADWGQLEPFALTGSDYSEITIDDVTVPVWLDPGAPPTLTDDPNTNTTYQMGNALVVLWSAQLDPNDAKIIDISPGAIGNLGPLSDLAIDQPGILSEYDGINGGLGKATGHDTNPTTGQPYEENPVPLGDYTRVLAEFWADGPDSETPPGHWFSVYNTAVSAHPLHNTQLEGTGDPIDPLEYDILAYLALGGAMHDSAISVWSVKRAYDYVRPISAIRYMAALGQSTDTTAGNYHVHGIPLVTDQIETINLGDPLAGENNEMVGKIKARAWRGPDSINDPSNDVAGVDWIYLENWWPYQRPTFVTPPFAGYVSGHSTFSSAAAEVLTRLTGDAFFPGGYAEFVAKKDSFLVFEKGPSVDVRLQWATYRDAADQTSLSRIWGGIHPPADDIVGRRMGELIGEKSWQRVINLSTGMDIESGINIEPSNPGSDLLTSSSGSGCSITGTKDKSPLFLLISLLALIQIFRRSVDSSDPNGNSVAANCGGDFSDATATIDLFEQARKTAVTITISNAKPNTMYTTWLRLKGTTDDGVSFGGNPLTGRGSTPLAPSTALPDLLSATGAGNGSDTTLRPLLLTQWPLLTLQQVMLMPHS